MTVTQGWRDQHGDLWFEGEDGLLHAFETAPFPREHVEKKWGPLTPSIDVDLDLFAGVRQVIVSGSVRGTWTKSTADGRVAFTLTCATCGTVIGPVRGVVDVRAAFGHHWLHTHVH